MNTYEGMFLFDPSVGAKAEAVQGEIDRLMSRAEAELIVTKPAEERRLAYEIKGRKRGMYVLTYFRAPGDKITSLERDIRLSEVVLRALILRVDGLSEERMQEITLGSASEKRPYRFDGPTDAAKPAQAKPTDAAKPAQDGAQAKPADAAKPAPDGAEAKPADAPATEPEKSKPELVASEAEKVEETETKT